MKRIPFKTEHKEPVLSDVKRATSRWKDQKWKPGEERAAVAPSGSGSNRRPAFLTPVKDAFCILECTNAQEIPWGEFTEEHAKKCGVTRAWYLKEKPDVTDETPIFFYEFKRVVKPFPWDDPAHPLHSPPKTHEGAGE